jgi:hypothetical protein
VSILWTYVRFQAMTFVFGIIGPIFLIAYFATQPDPTARWMYWWGLIITAVDVIIALSLTRFSVEADEQEEQNRLAKRLKAASNPFGRKQDSS